jgi:hypothetical protein
MSTAFYVCAVITAASALVSLGYSVVALLSAGSDAELNARYTTSRSMALALVSFVPFFYHSTDFLAGIAITMTVVQFLDAVIGWNERDRLKTYGPAITGVVNLLALIWLR